MVQKPVTVVDIDRPRCGDNPLCSAGRVWGGLLTYDSVAWLTNWNEVADVC
jgi:hypothetical protein